MLEAAVFGAYFNVMINLKDIKDEKFKLAVSRGRVYALDMVMRMKRDRDEASVTPRAQTYTLFATSGMRGVVGG